MENHRRNQLIVLIIAALIYLGGSISPPGLMDDVDAVQAQIARNMLESGDWVTARLDGVAYLEKAPLNYWLVAVSYNVFGVTDWAGRLPFALAAIGLAWLVSRMAAWAFGERQGLYAGLAIASSTGLWLFTRIQIPDVMLTLTIALALWAFVRALEEDSRRWALTFWACMGIGFLLKGLIAMVFPMAAALLYLTFRRQWRDLGRLHVLSGMALTLVIAAPWVILATLANPPYFDFTMRSAPGEYHGFFWFFFLNEHLFRFLNMRYPRDYNTVPRLAFWLFHLLWFFPFSAYLAEALRRRPTTLGDRADRMRLLCWCWAGFILVFFTFSTTQEYYSMPAYPAFAILIGDAAARNSRWNRWSLKTISVVSGLLCVVLAGIAIAVRGYPTEGDISRVLTLNPDAYTLSLGHMSDLTLPAFAYLQTPLWFAVFAFAVGAIAAWRSSPLGLAAMMVLFTHAARLALIVFDPYLGSRPLAEALMRAPQGEVIFDNQYYTFSSVFFYTNKRGLLLNGRVNNLQYGSYAPGAPQVFIDDAEFTRRWMSPARHYLLVEGPAVPRIEGLVGKPALHVVAASGGKFLLANQ